jgi:excinuclease UvrABC helicase subunit UvrB
LTRLVPLAGGEKPTGPNRSPAREHTSKVDVTDAASLAKAITELEKQMKPTAKQLEFKEAAQLRDRLKEPRAQQIYKT